MDIREILQMVWRWRAGVLLGFVVAAAASALTLYRVDVGVPPTFERRSIETGAASTQLLVDLPQSAIAKTGRPLEGLTSRAGILAELIETPEVVKRIAGTLGVSPAAIAFRGAPPGGTLRGRATTAEQRATEVLTEEDTYRLVANAAPNAPVISLFASAPSPGAATRLVDAAADVLPAYMRETQVRQDVPADLRLQIRHLGTPQGDWVNRGADYTIAALAFLAGLLVCGLLLPVLSRARQSLARERAKLRLTGAAGMSPAGARDEGL